MSKLRSVNTHFWSDNYVIDLDPIEKLLFLYLLTNENTNMLGIYELHIRKISFDTGIDKDMVLKIFERFHKNNKATYMEGHVILHNFLKHQNLNGNMQTSAVRSFNDLPQVIRKQSFCKPIVKALKGFGKASEPIAELEYEYELEDEREYEPGEGSIDENSELSIDEIFADEDSVIHSPRMSIVKEGESGPIVNGVLLPEPLRDVDQIAEAYSYYVEYMKENFSKHPTSTTTQMDLQKLMELQEEGNDPVEVIKQTIQARNKSFYALRDYDNSKKRKTFTEFLNEQEIV